MRSLHRHCLLAAVVFAPFLPVDAQLAVDRHSVTLTPDDPEQRATEVIVRNISAGEVEASVSLADWSADPQGASHWTAGRRSAGSCGQRVTVSPAHIRLGPGEVRAVRIAVRGNASFASECWAAAVLQPTKVATRPFSSERTTISRSTVALYVTPSQLEPVGDVRSLRVVRDWLEIAFVNTGGVRADLTGEVHVRSSLDSTLLRIPLPPATVLAGTTRKLRVRMPVMSRGSYQLLALVDYGGEATTAAHATFEMR